LTLIPWQRGKPLTWDVTVAHTLADSYVNATARSGGEAAEQAAAGRKTAKYDPLAQAGRLFQPIAAETTWPVQSVIDRFLFGAGPQDSVYFRRQPRAQLFSSAFRSLFSSLTRSCSTTVSVATRSDHFSFLFTFSFAFNPRDLYTRGYKK